MGIWDGRIRLFKRLNSTFPAGLTKDVAKALEAEGVKVEIDDQRRCPPIAPIPKDIKLFGVSFEYPYDYQLDCMEKMIIEQRGVVAIATGGGKCLTPDTPVLLHNGTVVRADQVEVGDELMGPDSMPRRVLSITTGIDEIYHVMPNRCGEPFGCNKEHILTLFDNKCKKIIDVSLSEYLRWNKDRKRLSRLVRTGVVFPKHENPLVVDPWLLGIWYAEGRKNLSFVEISNPDKEVEYELRAWAKKYDFTLNVYVDNRNNRCPSWRLVTPRGKENWLLTCLRYLYDDGEHLPFRYLTGTTQERSEFLAGIIDGDGSSDGKNIEIISKHKNWALDIAFLARSLGFGASIRPKKVKLKTWTECRTYWRVVLVGSTVNLPLRLARKHCYSKAFTTHTGFRIQHIGVGKYCGFTLDGDGRFVLGDFTITHNSEIACLVAACLRLPTLFLVPGKELLYQTQKRFAVRFGLSIDEIGIIGDSIWKPNQWITIAIVASMYEALKAGKDKAINLLDSTQLLFIDECHKASSDSWYDVVRSCNAFFRYGLSGTPLKRSDGADLKLIAATGPIIYEIRNKFLIEKGINSEAEIRLIPMRQPEIPKKTPYRDVYRVGVVDNLYRNRILCMVISQLVEKGHRVVVMVKEIEHGNQLEKRLWTFKSQSFLTHQFINGKEPSSVRQRAIRDFENGDLQILICSTILDEGVDIPCIDAIVLAGGGKSSIKTLQRIGRGLRKGKTGKLIIVDTIDFQHKYLLEHSYQRLQDYRAEDCFTIVEHKVEPQLELPLQKQE
jgi:superfamily II DNA or RNA helicase